ncbi:MAG TPA: M12 family metallo-peptidase [Opitutaceae bacterium]|nr:M12 family metallo-peptidase [Opitutaceae bacterium]
MKKRILVTGSFLTLLAAVAFVQRAPSQQAVSSVKAPKQAASNATPRSAANSEVSRTAVATAEKAGADFTYISKPSNSQQIESTLGTPSREVAYVNVKRLVEGGEKAALIRPGSHVELSMPDGSTLPLEIKSAEALGDGSYTSEAQVSGSDAVAVFAVTNGELSANIDGLELGSWQVRAIGGSVAQVFKVDPALVPPCGDDMIDAASKSVPAAGTAPETLGVAAGDVAAGATTTTSGTFAPSITSSVTATHTVRILVPYSKKILNTVSSSAVTSGINLAIATMNTDLARSTIPLKVVLAGAPAITYSQDGTDSSSVAIDRALTRVTSGTDGIIDSVHCNRYDAKADLVCFLINQVDSTNSGVGYVLKTPLDAFNPTYAFSVISYGYLNSSRTFSHEIGHNLGCAHDRGNATSTEGGSATGSYAYSYGYRFYGKNGTQYRTIMAYPPGQVAAYYSNPNITAASPVSVKVGVTVGTSGQAANAQTIAHNEAEVANYHNSRLVARMSRNIRGY